VVTDPVLRGRIFHLRRRGRVDRAALADVGTILISHVHHDHLDLPSLGRLDLSATVVIPAGAGDLVRRRGFRDVREVAAGDELELGALRVRATYAEHESPWRYGAGRTKALG
jgi:L-ascorbate metabolism protein UlaG (beta-lactamase superfamily)